MPSPFMTLILAATETTEISSVCSNNSSHETKEEYQGNQIDTPAQK